MHEKQDNGLNLCAVSALSPALLLLPSLPEAAGAAPDQEDERLFLSQPLHMAEFLPASVVEAEDRIILN